MAFLQQGSSEQVSIAAGESIAVGAVRGATANVTFPVGYAKGPSSTVNDGTATYGPFATATTVTVYAAQGTAEYVTGTSPVCTDGPVALVVNAYSGAVTPSNLGIPWSSQGLVNTVLIGDSFTAANSSGMMVITAASRTNNVVTCTTASTSTINSGQRANIINMLDSSFCANAATITVINGTSFSYPSVGANGSTSNLSASAGMGLIDIESQLDYGAFVWLNAKSGGAFNLLNNGGCNGQTSTDMLARFSRDCLAYAGSAKLLILQAGYNDFAINSFSAATVYANVTSMAVQAVNAGMKVVILGALPWSSGVNTSFLPVAMNYNRLIRNFCNATLNCRYADSPAYITNSTSTTFAPITGMLGSDGIHPSSRGGERQGQALWDALQYESVVPKRLISTLADTPANNPTGSNLTPYAPFTNSGGALAGSPIATGTACGGFGITNTSAGAGATVASAQTGFDGVGFNQQVVFTPALSNDSCTIGSQGYNVAVTPGQKVVFSGKFSLVGLSAANIKQIDMVLAWSGGNKPIFKSVNTAGTSASYVQTDQTITVVSQPITIPVGVTNVGPSIVITAAGAGSALTFNEGRVSLEVVT